MLKLVANGFYIDESEILFVIPADSAAGKDMISESKSNNTLITCCRNEPRRSIIVLKNHSYKIATPLTTEEVKVRCMAFESAENGAVNKKEA